MTDPSPWSTGPQPAPPAAPTSVTGTANSVQLPTDLELADPVGSSPEPRSRLSTGKLVFLVLTFALAPIGAVAVGAGTRSITTSEEERQTLLAVSAREYARRLASHFATDGQHMTAALATLSKPQLLAILESEAGKVRATGSAISAPLAPPTVDPDTSNAESMEAAALAQSAATVDDGPDTNPFDPACASVMSRFPGGRVDATQAQIVDRRTGANLCVSGVPADTTAIDQPIGGVRIDLANRRLIYSVAMVGSNGRAELIYPIEAIANDLPRDGALPINRMRLMTATDELEISQFGDVSILGLDLESKAPVGQTGLALDLSAPRSWFKTAEMLTMLTPIGMWLLAVLLSWLVVDRILLTPIQQLRRRMALYRPGDTLTKPRPSLFAAQEVVTLDEMMERLAENVAADKAALAAGLEAQRALTREVHHRVKNNLQIIASLISLHSRDASSVLETRAYRAIQRRVDALAVVHRHLHAESEGATGIALGTMLSELSVALRHSLALDNQPVGTTINVEPARAVQDVALPAAFFVTELVELAVQCDGNLPVVIALVHNVDRPGTATLSVTSQGLGGCADRLGDRFASYERVLTGLSRQLRQPLVIDEVEGRYSIVVPVTE